MVDIILLECASFHPKEKPCLIFLNSNSELLCIHISAVPVPPLTNHNPDSYFLFRCWRCNNLLFFFLCFCLLLSVIFEFSFHAPVQKIWNSQMILICFSNSSCQERTARTAPSIVFPATGARTQTRLCTLPWHPLSVRATRPHLPRSLCRDSQSRTPQETGPSRENRTPLRFGPSPGACMKVGVSIFISGGGWMRAAWGIGSVQTLGVLVVLLILGNVLCL